MHLKPWRALRRPARRLLAGAAATALLLTAGCTGSSLDDASEKDGDTITIGLIWAQSGPYKTIGDDNAKGWQLYLDAHGGKLGGHPVKTVTGDEGTSAATALTAAKKLLDSDRATVLVGTTSGEAHAAISGLATQRKVPFIGTGGRASVIKDVTYTWNTSWLSKEMGAAIAPYIQQTVKGSVYVIGPDYQGGWDQIGGFTDTYVKAGGELANPGGKPTWTPWPATTNYLPYLNQAKDSGAKAVYAFYGGTSAVDFVKQYRQANLDLPLYAAGFLTEGTVLAAEGADADGVHTVLNYAANLDNPANREFVTLYQRRYGSTPNIYAVAAWDAALVLDQAITAAATNPSLQASTNPSSQASTKPTGRASTNPTSRASTAGTATRSQKINNAIGTLNIASPRGDWGFGSQHSPNQKYYLRRVQTDGRTRANVLQQTLTKLTN